MGRFDVSGVAGARGFELKRLLFVVTEDWYFVSHRLHLALAAIQDGYQVAVLTRVSQHRSVIEESGVQLIDWSLDRSSFGIFSELRALKHLVRVISQLDPDVVHAVAMKPVLYCGIIHRTIGKFSFVAALGGLGFIFSSSSSKAKIIRQFVCQVFRVTLNRPGVSVILQNEDDYCELEHVLPRRLVTIIRGAGVDAAVYRPEKVSQNIPVVMLPARMLWSKGVGDFVEVAAEFRKDGTEGRFVLVGDPDLDNPESVPIVQLERWVAEGSVEWWGRREDMPRVLNEATVICFPSYREGLPKSLLEAASCEKPIVAYDVPGCREVVIHKKNGLLTPAHDVKAMATAVKKIISDPVVCQRYGAQGRRFIKESFSQKVIAEQTKLVWESLH